MWLLVLVVFSGPGQIDRVEVLMRGHDMHNCIKRLNIAKRMGLPRHTDVSCIPLTGISEA
jgi:hypothetical protein